MVALSCEEASTPLERYRGNAGVGQDVRDIDQLRHLCCTRIGILPVGARSFMQVRRRGACRGKADESTACEPSDAVFQRFANYLGRSSTSSCSTCG